MFQPPIFREDRPEVLRELITTHPFATVVTSACGSLTADHVPLVFREGDGLGQLQGHVAVANPLFHQTTEPFEVLVIFQGPQAYVSPSWYPSKKAHGKAVPTWNYAVVHVRGRLSFVQDKAWVLAHLNDLTDQHEGQRAEPWQVTDAPSDFVDRQLRGLAGFEISINEMQGTWKVSQNKSREDREGVQTGLRAMTSPEAHAMADLIDHRVRR